ncbi:uncharacterized protein FTJAE_674 [Fusarium tjaetaba]|uniref:Uncharacterized protein n=1 Tax=Fusarium tjaetaba TaxID=1567544 RepID=A0A8H5SBP9_9HYPO|nr:uncharacterized protein FTJAE_674 [Fusarium tjaetaba]KAF5650109.1 hypothetical protein FTJAE_674 [Fusarium tjaetaba]
MAITSNNTPSTQGHAPSPPNLHGVDKSAQNSSGATKTDNPNESSIFHLEAAWGTEKMDVSLKVGPAGLALIFACAFLALVALVSRVTVAISVTPLHFWIAMAILVLLLVVLGDSRGSDNVRSGP